jgi:ADP-ribosylglycohydrolase
MSKYVDAIIGHAIGDAMGVPTEFISREKLLSNTVTKMISSDIVGEPAGTWSDDTSMEIATIDSFIDKGCFDYHDIMSRWVDWIDKGRYTANDRVFDVGRTCLGAIRRFKEDGINPIECGLNNINTNGNGSLMRILPVALYSYSKKLSDKEIIKLTNEMSSLTHGHDISKLGCYIYVKYVKTPNRLLIIY